MKKLLLIVSIVIACVAYFAALVAFAESRAIRQRIGDTAGLAGTLWNIAFVYEEQARRDEAWALMAQSIAISRRIGCQCQRGDDERAGAAQSAAHRVERARCARRQAHQSQLAVRRPESTLLSVGRCAAHERIHAEPTAARTEQSPLPIRCECA